MGTIAWRRASLWLLIAIVMATSVLRPCRSQEAAAKERDFRAEAASLEVLPANEYGKQIVAFLNDAAETLDAEQHTSLKAAASRRATRHLSAASTVEDLTEWELEQLVTIADVELSPDERVAIRSRIDAARMPISALSFDDLGPRMTLMRLLSDQSFSSVKVRRKWIADWITNARIDELSPEQLRSILSKYLCPVVWSPNAGCEVEWRGTITPPRDGNYTFSTCNVNLNSVDGDDHHFHTFQVWIGDVIVLESTPERWKARGNSVALKGGKPVQFRARYRYEHPRTSLPQLASAVLYWSGPGMSQEIVPRSVFQRSDRNPGLDVTWQTDAEGGRIAETAAVANVDFASLRTALPEYADTLHAVADHLLEEVTSAEYLAAIRGEDDQHADGSQVHPFFSDPTYEAILTCATSAKRRKCLSRLLEEPQIIKEASLDQLRTFLSVARVGADEESIHVLGLWFKQNALPTPSFSEDYLEANRRNYRELLHMLAYEQPGSLQLLQDEYLATENGGCCLSTAYALAYAYLAIDMLDEWINFIDAQLIDKSFTGDARATWLLARAQAEELAGQPVGRFIWPAGQPLAGLRWIDEAIQAAEGNHMRLAIVRERIARFSGTGQWLAADHELTRLDTVDGASVKATWQQRIAELKAQHAKDSDARRAAADTAYEAELSRRTDQADARGDLAAKASYQAILTTLESGAAP